MDDLKRGAYMGNFRQVRAGGSTPSIGSIIGDSDLDHKIKGMKVAYKYMGIHSKMGRAKGLTSLVAASGKSHQKGASAQQKQEAIDAAAALDSANEKIDAQQTTIDDLQEQIGILSNPPVEEPITEEFSEETIPL